MAVSWKNVLMWSVISSEMLDHQIEHLFHISTAQCSVHLRKPRRILPPSHTEVITQSCRIMQSTEECFEYGPWMPRTSFQNLFKTKKALGEASAVLSADLSITKDSRRRGTRGTFLALPFWITNALQYRLGFHSPVLKRGARPVGLPREERAAPRSLMVWCLIVASITYILFSSSYSHIL